MKENKMKFVIEMVFVVSLFFSGCATKSGLFSPDIRYQSALAHTQRGELYNSLELKASIVATYLNDTCIACAKGEDEEFLVAVYIDEDSSDESKEGLMNPAFHLTLNGQKPSDIRALDYHDDLIKIAPFRNRWSRYYIVKFPKQQGDKLDMVYAHHYYGKVTLVFLKE